MRHELFKFVGGVVAGLCLFTAPSWAQTVDFASHDRASSSEARLSLTLPFGARPRAGQDKPQLQFGVRQYNSRAETTHWVRRNSSIYQENKVALTLEASPQFLINNQVLTLPEDGAANVSTLGKIGIGVGVTVVVLGGLLLIAIDNYCDDGADECSS